MKSDAGSSNGTRRRAAIALAALCLVAGGLGEAPVTRAAGAAGYPDRPIKIVVPFGAGSQIDIAARLVGGKLAEAVGQPVIIENRPGASANIGSEVVAKAPPDGYTLLLTGSLITLLPSTLGSVAVNPVTSFAPITKLAEPPIVIVVNPSLDVSTLAELVALAKREPGKISYATAGIGTVQHLIGAIVSRKAGIDMVHVPYANTGQALKDVQAGVVQVYFTFLGPIDGQLRSGQLKALAVASTRRMQAWPDIPTVAELGYKEAVADPWNGVLAPIRAVIRKYKDDERMPTTMLYRRELSAAEFERVGRAVRMLKANERRWHLIFYNCNDFAIEIAEALGLWRPPSLLPPSVWVGMMRKLNER